MTADALYCGVDVGATATKLVLLDGQGRVLARAVRPSGVDYAGTARACLAAARREAADDRPLARTVATGYGRRNVDFADSHSTEIHCHGLGAYAGFERSLTVVDIGGQDNKVIHLDKGGRRVDFHMNRKCAAGTGAFIEEMALRLDLDLGAMDGLARSTSDHVRLSSFCTVFAKTEILAHLRRGAPVAAIVRGTYVSVIDRVLEMDPLAGFVVMSGGVAAHHPVVAEILAGRLGRPVNICPHPQFVGALGAALSARAAAPSPGTIHATARTDRKEPP